MEHTHCWRKSVDFGKHTGVRDVTLLRTDGGSVLMLLSEVSRCNLRHRVCCSMKQCVINSSWPFLCDAQVAALTNVAMSTTRDRMHGKKLKKVTLTRQHTLNQLRAIGAIEVHTTSVAATTVNGAAGLWKLAKLPKRGFRVLLSLKSATPPPLKHTLPRPAIAAAAPCVQQHTQDVQPQRHDEPYLAYGNMPFPSTLPECILLPHEVQENYGICKGSEPRELMEDISRFKGWSGVSVNTERGPAYVHSVQSTSLEDVGKRARGYLGYVSMHFHVPPDQLTLSHYQDPQKILHFMSYLKARGASVGHITNHLSLARKINDYLKSGSQMDHPIREHASRMDEWLGTLEAQMRGALPRPHKGKVPGVDVVWAWGAELAAEALAMVERDQAARRHITTMTALMVQQAIIVSLVIGLYMPPPRLHFIKSVLHPRHAMRLACPDPDCLEAGCRGNRLVMLDRPEAEKGSGEQWHYGYANKCIKFVVPHHKNDRRPSRDCLEYEWPRGDGLKLLMVHITEGHALIAGDDSIRLFTTTTGKDFTDINFNYYWNVSVLLVPHVLSSHHVHTSLTHASNPTHVCMCA